MPSPRVRTLACLGLLFLLNAYIVHNLFHTEFTQETASVDIVFMAFSRWLADHWNDRGWFPLWVMGLPSRQVYNPMLHHSVAVLSQAAGWTVQHAYHFITASTYALGPVTLFWLCYRFTARHGYALLAGLIYSVISPSAFLATSIRLDNGGLFEPRRFQTLVHYGEGPHVTALMLIPLVIWLIDEAAANRRWQFLPLATIALACVPLTNWTGTTGLMMALPAYLLAKWGAERPVHWPTLAGIGLLAYALASYWIPPSLIAAVQSSSVGLDIVTPAAQKAAIVAGTVAVLLALHFAFRHNQASATLRFFTYFTLISGTIILSKIWFGKVLVPIAHRFQLETEMAISGLAAYIVVKVARRWPVRVQLAAATIFAVILIPQVRHYRYAARFLTEPTDVSQKIEVRMSRQFAAVAQGERVFAPGIVALWLNHFSDTPQFFGCCDQSVRNDEFRHALYNVYMDESAEAALAWLKAYGIGYVGVVDTGGDQAFQNPRKFEGILEEVWREGNSAIYRVPLGNRGIAHVVPESALSVRPIVGGRDIEPLQPLLAALDGPRVQAEFRWLNEHEAEITADTQAGEMLLVQQTCDPGWHAYEGATERPTGCGPLGLLTVDPQYAGPHEIRIAYEGDAEDRAARGAQIAGLLLLALWTGWARYSRPKASTTLP